MSTRLSNLTKRVKHALLTRNLHVFSDTSFVRYLTSLTSFLQINISKPRPILHSSSSSPVLKSPASMESNPIQSSSSSLYPTVDMSNPEAPLNPSSSTTSNLYPSLDMNDLANNLFPDQPEQPEQTSSVSVSAPPPATEEEILRISGAILHLIDKSYSVELACGDLVIIRILQGGNVVAVLARVADEIQWPLTKDENSVKVDESHYFFTLRPTKDFGHDSSDDEEDEAKKNAKENDMLNYGLTIASKGQEHLLNELEQILADYSCYTVQQVSEEAKEVLDVTVAREISPVELTGERKEIVEKQCAAYWTTLAPNVEDYSGKTAKLIASGSGHLIKGILWCGDVTMDRLMWGNDFMKRRLTKNEKERDVHPDTLKRIKRVKRMTKMTENVANGILSGVVKVSGFFTSSVANSKVGKKFFSLLPGEIILATLDGFNKVCDAVEVAGRNVMSTSSTVTTQLVHHKYGGKSAEATNEGLEAVGHAVGTAWVAFKIRKAINPKSVLKPSTLAKTAIRSAASGKKA